MSHELICNWLGLPAGAWPPDHYRLLGLEPGEEDLALIEQHVHQRLDAVRRYQMMHPEQATEVMNRLAQAFVCLTEPAAKKAYDQALLGERAPRPPSPPTPPPLPTPPVKPPPLPETNGPRDPLVWLYTPGINGPGEVPPAPPVRVPAQQTVEAMGDTELLEPPPPPPPPPPAEPVDTIVEAARASPQACRGLATRRALYRRVARTRELLRLWHRLGKHLVNPENPLGRPEATDLYRQVNKLEETLDDFPLLGEAGQPGYLIVSLTQLGKARALQNLTLSQRESLERDWQAGLRFLEAHRDYLRVELKRHRRRSRSQRALRALRSWINDQPLAGLLFALVLLAIAVAMLRLPW